MKPLNNKVFIVPEHTDSVTKAGIILTNVSRTDKALVKYAENNDIVNKTILYDKQMAIPIEDNLFVIDYEDIWGVYEDNN